ncbi:MAG: hypothetical protein HZC11_03935 [Nitrospirae bacterium]|nr:hypothetical protein [Nitrospirota bacterium]
MEKRISIGAYIIIFVFAVFLIRLWHLQIIKGKGYKKIADQNRLRIIKVPAPRGIIYDRNNVPLVKNIPAFSVSVIKTDLPHDIQTLAELGNLLDIEPENIKERLNSASVNPFEAVKLKDNILWEEVARIEARRIDFPGLQIDVETGREYIYGQVGSHVVGYLGRITPVQEKSPEFRDVPISAFIGQWGIEKIYDRTLRGTAGEKIIEVDATGKEINVLGEKEAVKGNDLNLTIDIDLQIKAEEGLKDRTGAVIAIAPNTGDILVLASTPSFDPLRLLLLSQGLSRAL